MCMNSEVKKECCPGVWVVIFLVDPLKTFILKYQKWCIMLKGMNIGLYRLQQNKSM